MQNIKFVEGSVCPDEITIKGNFVYIAKNIKFVERVDEEATISVYQYELNIYTLSEYEAFVKQNEILNAVNLSNEEIANDAIDAYTLELMEAGVL